MKEKRFPYMHYLWTCTHFPFLPPPPHLLESCKAPFAPGLCQLALCHKSISSIHLLSSCLGNSPVSPLTCNGAALLSGLLTNWPIMGVMDAAGSCLPLRIYYMSGLKCLLRILGSEEYPVAAANGAASPSASSQWINK